jgi:hypothetical protein
LPIHDEARSGWAAFVPMLIAATYQLFGLDAVRKKVASACAWPPSAQASSEKR